MGVFFKGIHQMRKINWSKGWLWDVMFEAGPSAFDGWFPATDITVNEATLEVYSLLGGNSTFEIPKNTTLSTINMTFTDNISLNVHKWVAEWINDIVADGATKTLGEIVRKVGIAKMENKNKIVEGYPKFYLVFPKGSLDYKGTSEEGPISNSIDFVIAGE